MVKLLFFFFFLGSLIIVNHSIFFVLFYLCYTYVHQNFKLHRKVIKKALVCYIYVKN
jgi:hypothetical protein